MQAQSVREWRTRIGFEEADDTKRAEAVNEILARLAGKVSSGVEERYLNGAHNPEGVGSSPTPATIPQPRALGGKSGKTHVVKPTSNVSEPRLPVIVAKRSKRRELDGEVGSVSSAQQSRGLVSTGPLATELL